MSGTTLAQIQDRVIIKIGDNVSNSRITTLLPLVYQSVLQAHIRENIWRCATDRIILTATGATPAFGPYNNIFVIPTGWLRLIEIVNPIINNAISWPYYTNVKNYNYQIEGTNILANGYPVPNTTQPQYAINCRYLKIITEEYFDSLFTDSLVWRLAIELIETMNQNMEKRQQLDKEYQSSILFAKKANAIEATPSNVPLSDLWLSRLGTNNIFTPNPTP